MPSESFFKIDEEKRNKILEAMKSEFGRESFEKASVNKIVEDAGISKGSFWCYFKSKEEAIEYLVKNHLDEILELIEKILIEQEKNIFNTAIAIFDYLIKNPPKENHRILMRNIYQYIEINKNKVIFSREDFLYNIQKEHWEDIIKNSNLQSAERTDIIYVLRFLEYIIRENMLDVITKRKTPEQAKEKLCREIQILKEGACKNTCGN